MQAQKGRKLVVKAHLEDRLGAIGVMLALVIWITSSAGIIIVALAVIKWSWTYLFN